MTDTPHARFADELQQVIISAAAISEHLHALTARFQEALRSNPSSAPLLGVTSKLAQDVSASSANFRDCLQDLATMGEAMLAVMDSCPEAAPGLMVNLYSTFFRQSRAYYRDMDLVFEKCSGPFEEGREGFYKITSRASASTSTPPSAQTPDRSSVREQSLGADERDARKSKKQKKTVSLADELDANGMQFTDADTEHLAAVATAAAAASPAKQKKSKKKSTAADLTPVSSQSYQPPEKEPTYLQVTTSVEDAQGRLISASRPNAFSAVSKMLRSSVAAKYYIRLVRPGSIAHYVAKNYITMSEDAQADLFCDVLETDCAEVEPMESPAGEVVVHDEHDLSSMPACAWRVGNNEDHSRLYYTMYTLVQQLPGHSTPAAVIQDSVVMTQYDQPQEVMHIVNIVKGAPMYAKVTCYVSTNRAQASDKTNAIIAFARSSCAQMGFMEVNESEVLAALPAAQQQQQSPHSFVDPSAAYTATDAKDSFQPPVQLASLDAPDPSSPGLTFGDAMRGAVRGGIGVLKAPLTVGRVVGGAVLDATGVTEAMRSSIEATFRKSFPHLEAEAIVDSFSAAWQENAMPKQGQLYLTTNWLCFVSTVTNSQFAVEYDEIKDIQKAKSAKLFDNAIEVITHLNERYFLTSFLQRDSTFQLLMQQWLKR